MRLSRVLPMVTAMVLPVMLMGTAAEAAPVTASSISPRMLNTSRAPVPTLGVKVTGFGWAIAPTGANSIAGGLVRLAFDVQVATAAVRHDVEVSR